MDEAIRHATLLQSFKTQEMSDEVLQSFMLIAFVDSGMTSLEFSFSFFRELCQIFYSINYEHVSHSILVVNRSHPCLV